MNTEDWRSQLAEPDLPPAPAAWPPAPAAVALGLFTVLLLSALVWAARRHYRRNAWRRAALSEWRRIATQPDPQQVSRLLRRIARERHGAAVAAMSDADFARHLQATSRGRLSADTASTLASCAHRPATALDARHLQALRAWIRQC